MSNACLGLLNAILQIANQIELGQIAAGLAVDLAIGVGLWMLAPGAVPLAAALLGAAVAATVEFAPLPLDDNVRVTLAGGAGIMLGLALF